MCLPAIPIAIAAASSTAAATGGFVAAASIPAAGAAAAAAATTGLTFTAAAASGISLATLATGASLLSGAVGAYGAYQQGQSQNAMNKYQAAVLGQQSILAKRAADANINTIQTQAANDSKTLARRVGSVMGAQDAAAAANGTAGSVTANDIKVDTFDTGHLDKLAIQYNADLKTWGVKEGLSGEQWNLGVEGDQLRKAGRNAASAGFINAGASLIGSAAQIANNRLLVNSRSVAGYG